MQVGYQYINSMIKHDFLQVFSDLRRSLILALGVCYHAGLHEKRSKFRDHISNYFEGAFKLEHGSDTIRKEISA